MKKDYQSVVEKSLLKRKEYLLSITSSKYVLHKIYSCFSEKALKKLLNKKDVYQQLYRDACIALYQTSSYDEMEYHLMMMNQFFHEESYDYIKDIILNKFIKNGIGLKEYCVLRHLIAFEYIPFQILVNQLEHMFHVSYLELAKICLLEDEYHMAYLYLKKLDECKDEKVLDLLCSYSLKDYLLLKKHYQTHKKVMIYQ